MFSALSREEEKAEKEGEDDNGEKRERKKLVLAPRSKPTEEQTMEEETQEQGHALDGDRKADETASGA